VNAGYRITGPILSLAECDDLAIALSAEKRSRAGVRHLMRNAAVAAVASDPRMIELACGAIPFRATLFEKAGDRNWLIAWHQDTALPLEARFESSDWGPWSIKDGVHYAHAPARVLEDVIALRLHLDESTNENGPLRVIPDSHRLGILTDEQVAALTHSPVECPVPKGGVLAMRPLLIHASSKASSSNPRRVLHIEYAGSLNVEPGVRLAIT
jgi:ectoine hydroxylase-related dioxygenase (phytanoyl-CoA dioxygenase family)